ncbi:MULTISPECIES: hypothetical protein [Cellulomonas]|uniref:hypothetical protein n=1 Tax=Cellulomonas TaxID=1707 RepID=UPI001A9E1D9A|nr:MULTISPECIES: hypothetical protein [Cellulomonas]
MAVVITLLLVALLVAAVALVAVPSRPDGESPWVAFRRGLRARRDPDVEQAEAARAAAARPVDLSLADFLRATASEGDGYLHPDELAEDLRLARERAAHVLRVGRDATRTHDTRADEPRSEDAHR